MKKESPVPAAAHGIVTIGGGSVVRHDYGKLAALIPDPIKGEILS